MKHLWQQPQQQQQQMLISIFTLIMLIDAKPSAIYSYPLDDAIPNELVSTDVSQNGLDDEIAKIMLHVNKTCVTSACDESINWRQIGTIKHHMRADVDPCVDFHQYACGNWPIVHDNATTMMDLIEQRVLQRYVDLFKNEAVAEATAAYAAGAPHSSGSNLQQDVVYQKMLKYYQTCQANATNGPLHLKGYLTQLENFNLQEIQNMHWLNITAHLGRFGYAGHLLATYVLRQNVSSYRLNIQTCFTKNQSNETQEMEHVPVELKAEIYDILKDLTALTRSELNASFISLETDLKAIANSINNIEEDVWLTFAELEQQIPHVDWQFYLRTLLSRNLHPTEYIQIDQFPTLANITAYLNNANQQILALYILTHFFSFLEQQPHVPLQTDAASQTTKCIHHMCKVLYLPMIYLYEQAYYANVRTASDQVIQQIYQQLKAEFSRTLNANKMNFTADILDYLQQKLTTMRLNLGNFPTNANATYFAEYVADLQITNNFYLNHLNALQHFNHKQFQLIDVAETNNTNVSDNIWLTFNLHNPTMPDHIDATPYFFSIGNIIIMPYAYLQQPFYDYRFWSTLLYGDLANTLGHELLHAFDSTFIGYDSQGNMNNIMFDAIDATELYKSNLNCLQNGTNFTRERIADISGTRLALNTFMKNPQFRQDNGKLYFLEFAQFFCGEGSDSMHDDNKIRLNYVLQQTPEFAEVFECAKGSPMNPYERCELW